MKNLKKVLALVLVVAMMASFATVSAAFPDADSINADYSVAVETLTGMGVIGGYADGTFRPTNLVTRGAFAKMVSYVMNSGKNAAASYGTSATLAFADVDAASVLAPSIGYVVTKGYVSGYADGTFRPSNNVTGLAAAKILLGAMGIEGQYTGTGWDLNVLSNGEDAGLFASLESVDLTKNLSREAACQMIWNAMNYSAKGATVEYVVTKDGAQLYKGTDPLTALALQAAGGTLTTSTTTTDSIGFLKFGLKKDTKDDAFGRTSTIYTNGKDALDAQYVVYSSFAPVALKTYTTKTTYGKIFSDLGYTLAAQSITLTKHDNSATGTAATVTKGDATEIGAQGTLVEVFKTGVNAYDVVVTTTYTAKIEAGEVVAAVAATATTDAVPAFVKIEGTSTDPEANGNFKTTAFKVGDVVLYTKADGKVQNVVKADFINGKVSATASNYFRIDGVQKYLSAQNSATIGTDAGYKFVTPAVEYTYYLDFYGNVIYAEEGVIAPVAKTYTYVIDTASAAAVTGTGSNLFEGAELSAGQAQAKVIDLATGEIKVVNLGIVKNLQGKYVYANANGAATTTEVTNAKPVSTAGIYEYVALADGSYVLGNLVTGTNVTIAKDSASVTGVTGAYANAATKVTVVEYTKNPAGAIVSAAVTTTTGIANFPQAGASYTGAIVDVNETAKTINSILVVKEKALPTATVDFAVYVGAGEFGVDGQAYAFYQNGAMVNYYLAEGTTIASTVAAGDVVAMTLEGGKIKTCTEQTAVKTNKKVDVLDATYAVIDGTVYYFANNYSVVDKNANYAASSLTVGAYVDVYTVTVGTNTYAAFFVVVG